MAASLSAATAVAAVNATTTVAWVEASASPSPSEQLLRRVGMRSTNSRQGWRSHGCCPLQQAKVAVSYSRRVKGMVRAQARKQPRRHEELAVRAKAAVNVESTAVTDESTKQFWTYATRNPYKVLKLGDRLRQWAPKARLLVWRRKILRTSMSTSEMPTAFQNVDSSLWTSGSS